MRDGRRAPLAVLGMGKLGGRELGYHSDLDLLFVYGSTAGEETTGGSQGRLGHHEYFARLVQRLLSLLTLQFREGRLYQVDTRLRPSGNQGPLVVSEEALVEHHSRRAQLWERQALVKARAVAGDLSYGRRLLQDPLAPLVWSRPLPSGAGEEIHRLRLRMEREVAGESAEQLNPKTGQGGLVDVEFATQYLQLRSEAALRQLRLPNTLEALEALAAAGGWAATTRRALREGYLFLRRVENRQRLVHGRPLQHLPTRGRSAGAPGPAAGLRGAGPGGLTFLGATARLRRRCVPPTSVSSRGRRGRNDAAARVLAGFPPRPGGGRRPQRPAHAGRRARPPGLPGHGGARRGGGAPGVRPRALRRGAARRAAPGPERLRGGAADQVLAPRGEHPGADALRHLQDPHPSTRGGGAPRRRGLRGEALQAGPALRKAGGRCWGRATPSRRPDRPPTRPTSPPSRWPIPGPRTRPRWWRPPRARRPGRRTGGTSAPVPSPSCWPPSTAGATGGLLLRRDKVKKIVFFRRGLAGEREEQPPLGVPGAGDGAGADDLRGRLRGVAPSG